MIVSNNIIESIKNGAVGVMPTDTIFGIVASVKYPKSLERIYETKGRPAQKKLIHLIGDVGQLESLGINLDSNMLKSVNELWPGPVSIEFTCEDTLPYLHRGTYCIAVRLPATKWLRDVLLISGPVVATSANISGHPVPDTIDEIKRTLPGLDFYIDGAVGKVPSKLARLKSDGQIEWLPR